MIKVLMCVYNGEKYIAEQLDSLLYQTKQPDEVIICDDKSTDSTAAIVSDYINRNHLDTWKLTVNPENLGWRRSFYNAITRSHDDNDILFFCDQDDVWNNKKIEIMSEIMLKDENILRLSGEQLTVDSDNNEIETWIRSVNTNTMEVKRESYLDNLFTVGWKNRIGCAMAIRGRLANYIAEHYKFDKYFAHDEICVNASDYLLGGYLIDYACIRYRVHGGNASHISNDFVDLSDKIERIKDSISHLEYIKSGLDINAENVNVDMLNVIDKQIELSRLRVKYLTKRNIFGILKARKLYNDSPSNINYKGDIADILGVRKVVDKLKRNKRK